MSPESLEALASVGGLLLALVGLPLVYLQLRDVQRSVRGGAHAAIYAQAADFRAHLVQHPHLRRYFFDGAEIDPEHEEYERVLTIADLFLNYLEHISIMADALRIGSSGPFAARGEVSRGQEVTGEGGGAEGRGPMRAAR